MGAYKYMEELWKKKQTDVMRFLSRVRTWELRQLPAIHRAGRTSRPDKGKLSTCYELTIGIALVVPYSFLIIHQSFLPKIISYSFTFFLLQLAAWVTRPSRVSPSTACA